MEKRLIAAAFGVAGVLIAGSAKADEVLLATYVDSEFSGSWEQYDEPIPDGDLPGQSTEISIWNLTGNLDFEDPDHLIYYSDGGFWNISGPRIYGGRESAPLFRVGVVTGLNYVLSSTPTNGVLTFTAEVGSAPAAPEPSTWAMMLAGFVGLGVLYAVERRRPRSA
jgi:hypothetical protein